MNLFIDLLSNDILLEIFDYLSLKENLILIELTSKTLTEKKSIKSQLLNKYLYIKHHDIWKLLINDNIIHDYEMKWKKYNIDYNDIKKLKQYKLSLINVCMKMVTCSYLEIYK